ncbi:DUF4177 domain-containing protein [Pseudooceanicola sp.]|uniref:DUF4177 domain-containing protein n=1 Tax=Pseudooceanicola sp. TaxID=1914328 RepID=UPI0035C72645
MNRYEYKVVPAPVRGKKGRGVRGPEGRFALSLEQLMNEMAAEGWEYQRAETLPSEEKSGLTKTQTVFRSVLIFRRASAADLSAFDPRAVETDAPLMLPAAEASSQDEAEDAPGPDEAPGLSRLLQRRAASVAGGKDSPPEAAQTDERTDPATGTDDEDQDAADRAGADAKSRSAAAE